MDETDQPNLKSILTSIAAVGADADRDTLVTTIDQSVDAVIAALDHHKAGEPISPDIAGSITVTLEFLEQCGQMGDASFRAHIKTRAVELQHVFQGAVSGDTVDAGESAPTSEATHESFGEAFTDYFCQFMGERLSLFNVETDPPQVPYVLNPAFTKVFVSAVRKYVVPDMLNHRGIWNMADSVAKEKLYQDTFYTEFNKAEAENIVQLTWSDKIKEIKFALSESDIVGNSKKKGKEEKKKGGIMGAFKKKEPKAAARTPAEKMLQEKAEKFWKALTTKAKDGGYDAPQFEDIDLFLMLMNFKDAMVGEAKTALRQFLEQEVKVGETREGATRDWLYKAVDRLPAHCGELMVLWAYVAHEEIFTPNIVRSFLAGQGTSDAERRRAVPLFTRWVEMPPAPVDEDETE